MIDTKALAQTWKSTLIKQFTVLYTASMRDNLLHSLQVQIVFLKTISLLKKLQIYPQNTALLLLHTTKDSHRKPIVNKQQ